VLDSIARLGIFSPENALKATDSDPILNRLSGKRFVAQESKTDPKTDINHRRPPFTSSATCIQKQLERTRWRVCNQIVS
jgi:hypothetical protein